MVVVLLLYRALNCFMDTEDLKGENTVETGFLMEAVRKCEGSQESWC